jgi:hypothetical protein
LVLLVLVYLIKIVHFVAVQGVDLTIAIAVMVLNVVLTILQHGDNFSNLGGMLFGLSFGFVILRRPVNRVHCITVSLVAFVG